MRSHILDITTICVLFASFIPSCHAWVLHRWKNVINRSPPHSQTKTHYNHLLISNENGRLCAANKPGGGQKDIQQQTVQNMRTSCGSSPTWMKRVDFLRKACTLAIIMPLSSPSSSSVVLAFEGGVGGLGKTKPETGVEFFNTNSDNEKPIYQDTRTGILQAELVVLGQLPILVSFYIPPSQPLSFAAAGLEARDLTQPESTYVHVVTNDIVSELELVETKTTDDESGASRTVRSLPRNAVKDILLNSVLSQQGKFGAYGSPTDIKVKKWKDASGVVSAETSALARTNNADLPQCEDLGIYQVFFTTLTPGLRESERVLLVSMRRVVSSSRSAALVMLVTGTTRQRFQSQQVILDKIASSWQVIPAPPSRLLQRQLSREVLTPLSKSQKDGA